MATFLTAALGPGIFMTDSATRWIMALGIVDPTKLPQWATSTWWPLMMSLWMAATWIVSGSMHLFGWLQAASFYFVVVSLTFRIIPGRWARLVAALIVFAFPLFWTFSMFITPDTWTATAICAAFLLLEADGRSVRGFPATVTHFLLCAATFSVLFGFRSNTVVLLPWVAYLLWRARAARPALLTRAAALACALAFVWTAPRMTRITFVEGSVAAFAFEHMGTLTFLDKEERRKHNLDVLGDTEEALRAFSWQTVDTVFWGNTSFSNQKLLDERREIRRRFFTLVRDQPLAYLQAKLRIEAAMLGVTNDLRQMELFDSHPPAYGKPFGIWYERAPDSFGARLIGCVNAFVRLSGVPYRPWIGFLTVGVGLILLRWRRAISEQHLLILAAAAAYYGGFLLLAVDCSFRYYLPSFVLLFALALRLAAGALEPNRETAKGGTDVMGLGPGELRV